MKTNFNLLTHSPERLNVISTTLGEVGDTADYSDADVGKPMVFAGVGRMKIASNGDAIEGFLDNIDMGGTSDGYTFGGVARANRGARFKCEAGGSLSLFDFVKAGAQAAAGTANASGGGVVVKLGAPESDTTPLEWRVVGIAGDKTTATTGDVVIVEKV